MILKSGVSSLYSIGKSSGSFVEHSETSLEIVSIEDGFIDQSLIRKAWFSFNELSNSLSIQTLRAHMKEACNSKNFTLPDGIAVSIGKFSFEVNTIFEEFTKKTSAYSQEILFAGRVMAHQAFL